MLLGTGGGVRAVLNPPWRGARSTSSTPTPSGLDGPRRRCCGWREAFDPDRLDVVLLVYRTALVHADVGLGDFMLDKWGALRRRAEREVVPYLYAGVQIVSPALFADAPDGAFSMNLLWDRAIAADRLRAVAHDGLWFHLSRPHDPSDAELVLHLRQADESANASPHASSNAAANASPNPFR